MSEREYDEGTIVADVPRGERAVDRVRICAYRGHTFVDVRQWFIDRATNELRPGKGATLRPESLPEIITALQKAAQMVKAG